LTHKNIVIHPARITFTDLKSHQANQPEAQEYPDLIVVVLSQPYMCFSSYSPVKSLQDQPRSSNHELQLCIQEKEREREREREFSKEE